MKWNLNLKNIKLKRKNKDLINKYIDDLNIIYFENKYNDDLNITELKLVQYIARRLAVETEKENDNNFNNEIIDKIDELLELQLENTINKWRDKLHTNLSNLENKIIRY